MVERLSVDREEECALDMEQRGFPGYAKQKVAPIKLVQEECVH